MSLPPALRQISSRNTPHRHQAAPTAFLSEVFATSQVDAAAVGFALAHINQTNRPILWVQDRMSQSETGHPYLPGLTQIPLLLRVDVNRPADVLTAMEDGLHCKGLAGVIGEIWGDHPAISFAASKRLAVRSEGLNLPCWLIRRAAAPNLSAARERWRVSTLPSAPHPDDSIAPGAPRWRAELFRSRFSQPGEWVVEYDRATDHLNFLAPFRDGTVAASRTSDQQRATG
jgi:protein ImuA